MSAPTRIHADKIRAYLATGYRLGHTPDSIILFIGNRSPRLAELYRSHGVDCGAFITAFNPRGGIQPETDNERGHAELKRTLQELGISAIEGSGSEEGSDWPAEKGCFALGLPLDQAKAIGARFDQDAIVWVGADAVPQLILLR
jgi:Protein of unknown function (DUF3293)